MRARGLPKRLAMAPTPEYTLRQLLGDVLTPAREAELRGAGRLVVAHATKSGAQFRAVFSLVGDGFEVVFLRAGSAAAGRLAVPSDSSRERAGAVEPRGPAGNGGRPGEAPPDAVPAEWSAGPLGAATVGGSLRSDASEETAARAEVGLTGVPVAGTGVAHAERAAVHVPPQEQQADGPRPIAAAGPSAPVAPPAPDRAAPLEEVAHEGDESPQVDRMLLGAGERQTDAERSGAALSCTEAMLELLGRAVQMRASDIHLADGQHACLRIDGKIRVLRDHGPVRVEALFHGSDKLWRTLSQTHAVDVAVFSLGRPLRVALFRVDGGLAAAVRLLPSEPPKLEALNLPVPLAGLVDVPNGLVVVCGATGSGKSTTLAALVQRVLDTSSRVVVTIEQPIECVLRPGSSSVLRRREVGRDVLDFGSGLRDALREDPDLILVGEIRDPDTIQAALTAAETGHLVLTSLHSRSAASAIERIVDAYPADRKSQVRTQLADVLRAIVAQRLLPRAHGSGRVAALEVLRVTHAVANVIREGRTAQIATLLQSGRREGMLCLERCLADYVTEGLIRIEDARAAANDPEALSLYGAEKTPSRDA